MSDTIINENSQESENTQKSNDESKDISIMLETLKKYIKEIIEENPELVNYAVKIIARDIANYNADTDFHEIMRNLYTKIQKYNPSTPN